MRVALFGAGFLGSWIAVQILPHVSELIVVDSDIVEKSNYDNAIFLTGQEGRSKSVALGALLRMTTRKPIHVYKKRIESNRDLDVVFSKFPFDLGILTFDNIRSRKLVHDWATMREAPLIEVGVTENYGVALWSHQMQYPTTEEELNRIEESTRRVRDVCSRLQFRPLGALMAGLVGMIIQRWRETGEKIGYTLTISENGVLSYKVR